MNDQTELKTRLKKIMVEDLMLKVTAEEIGDAQPLFGPDSLGLDSVDALQLVVALEKNFQFKVANPNEAKTILATVNAMADAIASASAK